MRLRSACSVTPSSHADCSRDVVARLPHAALPSAPAAQEACPRPQPRSTVEEPADLRSTNGVLEVTLTARNSRQSDGMTRYCYTDAEGRESPNLRVSPGDEVIIHLKNELTDQDQANQAAAHMHHQSNDDAKRLCTSTLVMSPVSTNLHFHGLTIPPTCHEDDVMKTSRAAGRCTLRISLPHSAG